MLYSILLAIPLLLMLCGQAAGGGETTVDVEASVGGQPPVNPPTTVQEAVPITSSPTQPLVVSPISPVSPSPRGQPAPTDLGTPVATIPGHVTLGLGAAALTAGDAILVSAANGLDVTIYADDEKTDCSIFILEKEVPDGWEPMIACGLRRSPVAVPIGPGRGRAATINPRSSHFGVDPTGADVGVPPGIYRVTFTYRTDPARGAPEPFSVSTPPFEILPTS